MNHAHQSSPRVAAIVVTYNRLELLKECLSALNNQTQPLAKIYVVDNKSTDGTEQWFRTSGYAKDSNFDFVQLGQNIGGAGGFKAGMAAAIQQSYDWLWLMDDDSICQADALESLLQTDRLSHQQLGVLASMVTDTEGQLLEMNRQFTFDSWTGDRHWIKETEFNKPSFEVDCTSFVGFMIRTEVVKQIGLPMAEMFIHFDDHEYSLRVRKHGYQIIVVTASKIVHKLNVMRQPDDRPLYIYPNELWKYYYGQRNEVYGLVRYIQPWYRKIEFLARRCYWAIKWSFIMVRYDHPWLRCSLLWRSYFDALIGRLGKRIDPATFKERL